MKSLLVKNFTRVVAVAMLGIGSVGYQCQAASLTATLTAGNPGTLVYPTNLFSFSGPVIVDSITVTANPTNGETAYIEFMDALTNKVTWTNTPYYYRTTTNVNLYSIVAQIFGTNSAGIPNTNSIYYLTNATASYTVTNITTLTTEITNAYSIFTSMYVPSNSVVTWTNTAQKLAVFGCFTVKTNTYGKHSVVVNYRTIR